MLLYKTYQFIVKHAMEVSLAIGNSQSRDEIL